MKILLVGAASTLAFQVLLILGAYEMRLTPEVVNCDKGRQTVDVRVTKSWRSYVSPPIVKRKIGHCRVWYQTSGGVGGSD